MQWSPPRLRADDSKAGGSARHDARVTALNGGTEWLVLLLNFETMSMSSMVAVNPGPAARASSPPPRRVPPQAGPPSAPLRLKDTRSLPALAPALELVLIAETKVLRHMLGLCKTAPARRRGGPHTR